MKRLGKVCARFPHPHSRTFDQLEIPHVVYLDTTASSSERSLESIKPKPFDLKPNRDILPEKTGTRLTRYLQCKSTRSPIINALESNLLVVRQLLDDIQEDIHLHLHCQFDHVRGFNRQSKGYSDRCRYCKRLLCKPYGRHLV